MSLNEILKIKQQKKDSQKELYNIIYIKAKNYIMTNAKNGTDACIFKIPSLVFGHPLVDIESTMEYITYKLTHKGFMVFPIDKQHIYISWDLVKFIKNAPIESKISLEETSDDLADRLAHIKFKKK